MSKFLFSEEDIKAYVNEYLERQDIKSNELKDKKIKDCVWTEISITQQVKPFESESQGKMNLKYIIQRFYKQHYCGGLI